MNRKTRCVADQLWDDLVRAYQELGYLRADKSGSSLEYNRLVFSEKYHLLTFEVNRHRFLDFPHSSSVGSEDLDRVKQYFKNIRVDIVDLGTNLYFNLWIDSIGQLLPANLVCV